MRSDALDEKLPTQVGESRPAPDLTSSLNLLQPEKYPADRFWAAWRNAVLYDEHTWGAHNSISQPDSEFVLAQWKIKQAFAVDAASQALDLLSEAVRRQEKTPRSEKPATFYVWNPTPWTRTDLVAVPAASRDGTAVTDSDGKPAGAVLCIQCGYHLINRAHVGRKDRGAIARNDQRHPTDLAASCVHCGLQKRSARDICLGCGYCASQRQCILNKTQTLRVPGREISLTLAAGRAERTTVLGCDIRKRPVLLPRALFGFEKRLALSVDSYLLRECGPGTNKADVIMGVMIFAGICAGVIPGLVIWGLWLSVRNSFKTRNILLSLVLGPDCGPIELCRVLDNERGRDTVESVVQLFASILPLRVVKREEEFGISTKRVKSCEVCDHHSERLIERLICHNCGHMPWLLFVAGAMIGTLITTLGISLTFDPLGGGWRTAGIVAVLIGLLLLTPTLVGAILQLRRELSARRKRRAASPTFSRALTLGMLFEDEERLRSE